MRKFEVGDIVVLKTGGPKMTVTKLVVQFVKVDFQSLICEWFDTSHHLHSGSFDSRALDKSEV